MEPTTNGHDDSHSNVVPLRTDDGELRARARAAMDRDALTLRGLAGKTDLSPPALGRWLDGESKAKEAQTVGDRIARWLDESGPLPASQKDYVETRSSELITSALSFAKANGDLVCIYGGPGVGKTRSVEYFKTRERNVWVATMHSAVTTVVPVLEEIAEALGLPDQGGGARRLHQTIRRHVAGLRGLLIIDEAQHLRTPAIEAIRSLHDATNVGVALVGNESVFTRITGGARQAHFAQIYSRIGMRVGLAKPKADDVRMLVAKRWGVDDPEVLAELERVAAQPGALRLVTKIMSLCAKRGTPITVDAVRRARKLLGAEV
jgi:DNA transposition AAA+ family ATPase